jgi:hypothetical protein
MMATQSSAPMEAAPAVPSPTSTQISQAGQGQQQAEPSAPMPLIPLHAPTMRPDEPVTHGVDSGPGADSSILGLQDQSITNYQNTHDMLTAMAKNPNASPALKFLAQSINGVY